MVATRANREFEVKDDGEKVTKKKEKRKSESKKLKLKLKLTLKKLE